MDIEMLDLILEDSITYFGVSKSVFLEKLSYIFNQERLSGEKGFLKIKKHKKRPNTYYLLLRMACYANRFVIEEEEGRIIKVYDIKKEISKDDIEFFDRVALFFGTDEKADFIPSNDYVMNVYRCTKAYEELVNDKIQVLTSNDIYQWLRKHVLLYNEIKDAYLLFKYNDFRTLFLLLKFLLEELQNYNEAKRALETFDDSNIAALHQWLVDYNRIRPLHNTDLVPRGKI